MYHRISTLSHFVSSALNLLGAAKKLLTNKLRDSGAQLGDKRVEEGEMIIQLERSQPLLN
jgi:hypothetical protein